MTAAAPAASVRQAAVHGVGRTLNHGETGFPPTTRRLAAQIANMDIADTVDVVDMHEAIKKGRNSRTTGSNTKYINIHSKKRERLEM